jgi:hypothetical protein
MGTRPSRRSRRLPGAGRRSLGVAGQPRGCFTFDQRAHTLIAAAPLITHEVGRYEIWLGILARKRLRRGSFTSTDDLRDQVLAFIDYYNRTMARPFRWTYQGKALVS